MRDNPNPQPPRTLATSQPRAWRRRVRGGKGRHGGGLGEATLGADWPVGKRLGLPRSTSIARLIPLRTNIMNLSQTLYNEAARSLAQARAIHDQYEGKAMPGDAARAMEAYLDETADYNRRAKIEAATEYLAEPQYKHPMTLGGKDGGYRGGSAAEYGPVSPEVKSFLSYIRTGQVDYMRKAALVEDATGLNLIPRDFAGTILKVLSREGVMRGLAFVKPTTRETVDIGSIAVGAPSWGRLEITGGPPADGLGAAAKDTITVHELSALAKIGVDELEDSDENLAATISQALAEKFAETEDDSFCGGNGTLKPFGLATSTANPITNSVTAAVSNTPTPDDLKALTFAVPARARKNGVFIGHSEVEKKVALWKDNNGAYLLQPSAAQGEPGTIFGYKWYTADGLPTPVTAGVTDASCIFGDVKAGYLIADRQRFSVQVLREVFATEGKVGLLVKERVGGDVVRPSVLAKYLL